MPRNSSGVYSLPSGVNPVVPSTIIATSWANPTLTDIASEITNSLDRNGRGGMLAAFKIADGTVSLPGLAFTNEPGLGLWRSASNTMHAAVVGANVQTWGAGYSLINTELRFTDSLSYIRQESTTFGQAALIVQGDTNDLLYFLRASNKWRISINGSTIFDLGTTGLDISGYIAVVGSISAVTDISTSTGRVLTGNGTQAAPSLTFINDTSIGLFREGAGVGAIVAGNVKLTRILSTGVELLSTIVPSGSVLRFFDNSIYVAYDSATFGQPAWLFNADANDYMVYLRTSNKWRMAVGGTSVFEASATGCSVVGTLDSTGAFATLSTSSASRFISTVATGTAPLTVASTTLVTNLNADLLDGLNSATAATANTIAARDASGYIFATYFNANNGDDAGAASHYIFMAASDGYYRRKTLANVKTEIVTQAAIEAAMTGASFTFGTSVATINLKQNCNIRASNGGAGTLFSTDVRDSTTASAANVYIDPTSGFFQRSTSSIKYKTEVKDAWYGLPELMKLRPITYEGTGIYDKGIRHGGLIAEEVYAAGLKEFVQLKNGDPDGLAYGNMVSLLVAAIQEQQRQIDQLKAQK